MALNDRQRRFCDEYLIDLNATQAYLRAGYSVSEKVAAVNAIRLLANVEVKAYIERRQDALKRKTGITQEAVLEELRRIAFANTTDMIVLKKQGRGFRVSFVPTDELSGDTKSALAGIKQGKFGIEVKLHDKVRALELLAKHLGLLEGKAEDTDNGLTEQLIKGLKDDI